MKAVVISDQSEPIQLVNKSIPEVIEGECLIKIKAASLNRRDQWIREGKYPRIQFGTTLGSDGCGVIVGGPSEWLGKEVVINPNIEWGNNPDVQSNSYHILGMPTDGTLAEYVNVACDRLFEKPAHLNAEQAAAIPLAGLTAYRAVIKKGLATKGKKLLITGIGGGVSQFALQFAIACGADVYVTSSDDSKIEKAIQSGAISGFNYKKDDWAKGVASIGGFDSIIDSAGGNHLNTYLKVIKPAGRIIMYGSTAGHPEKLDVFRLFWSQAQIMGTTMGSDLEFAEMVNFIKIHEIVPSIDKVFLLEDFRSAFDRFKAPGHYGKIILTMDYRSN